MQLRRALLILGIVVLGAAGVASFVAPLPEPAEEDGADDSALYVEAPRGFRPPPDDEAVQIAFRVREAPAEDEEAAPAEDEEAAPADPEADSGDAPTKRVDSGEQVIVTVSAETPGEIDFEGLGLSEPVDPLAPAVFDLFTDSPGRYDVLFTPIEGEQRPVGTLVVEEPSDSEAG